MLTFISENKRENLIIFVHGFIGGNDTWLRKDSNKSILNYLREDDQLSSQFDFATFDYHTTLFDGSPKTKMLFNFLSNKRNPVTFNIEIDEISKLLTSEIAVNCRSYERIVLISHSMGGLVAKSHILREIKANNRKVRLYISLAVPHRGANLAALAKMISSNPQIANLEPLSDLINSIGDEWVRSAEQLPETIYFQAQYDQIVPKVASVGIDSREIDIVYTDDDHFSIVCPNQKNDVVITAIKNSCVKVASRLVKSEGANDKNVILDIGTVHNPNKFISNAEVRFSLTNVSKRMVKITSIYLEVLNRKALPQTIGSVPAGPIDEYFLHVRIENESHYELISQHHELLTSRTDGFFLKIDAIEGYEYRIVLKAVWHFGGESVNHEVCSTEIDLKFPASSSEALIELINKLN